MTTPDLQSALAAWCARQGMTFFPEFRVGTGYGPDAERTLDGWASHPHVRYGERRVLGFEIKVSRGDWLRELAQPLKRRAGMRACKEFWIVAPLKLIELAEVPLDCGLMEVCEDGHVKMTVHAPVRDQPPTWRIVAAVARRVGREVEGAR